MENRIKEQFTLFADRVSAESLRANQLRLYFSAIAYLLVCGLRRLGLKASINSLGMEEVLTAPQSPWQNPYAERLSGSIRRELSEPLHHSECAPSQKNAVLLFPLLP